MKSPERGSATIWMLGLSLMLLALGGLAMDFWRALTVQVELNALADSAAVVGASGVDEGLHRTTGEVTADEGLARVLVARYLEHEPDVTLVDVSLSSDSTLVTVTVEARVTLGLLRILVDDDSLTVRASASARATLVPPDNFALTTWSGNL